MSALFNHAITTGAICPKCFVQTNEPRPSKCERPDCPGRQTFAPFQTDHGAMRQRLHEKIAENDVARGRPLTDRERLENLVRALSTPEDNMSVAEKDAVSEAAMAMADCGTDIKLPWNCDLDDLERSEFNALVEACRRYADAMRHDGSMTNPLPPPQPDHR